MNYLALMFAAIAKPVDVPGQFRAVIVTLIVFVFIIKIVGLFMPTKRHLFFLLLRNQKGKTSNGKLIPCPDCKGSISPKASVCPHCGAPIDASYARKIYEGRNRALIAKRESNFMANMIVMGFLGLGLAICALASMSKVPGMGLFACIGLVLFFVAALRIYVHFNKGKIGELLVKARLRKGLPAEQYSILNNIFLPIDDGATTQIDHVVVSRFGIFVVETKNYSGWIFAGASSEVWTQTIYHAKNSFQNPIRQNYRHVCAIADNLGVPKEYIRGVVVFTGGCEFKTPMPDGVVFSRQLAGYIRSFSTLVLKESEKDEIVEALREWDASITPRQRADHVKNLKKRHQ